MKNDARGHRCDEQEPDMSYLTVPQFDAAYWSIIVCGVIPVAIPADRYLDLV